MAQAKPEVNRSQLIRDFVTKNPAMPISEVVTALGKEGIKVSKNLVYVVKMKMKAKKVKEKKAKSAAKEYGGPHCLDQKRPFLSYTFPGFTSGRDIDLVPADRRGYRLAAG